MDDLIRRQAALAAIQNLYPGMPRAYGLNRWHEENDKYIECEEAIKKLPSIKLKIECEEDIDQALDMGIKALKNERKKGKWIYRTEITCSVCGSPTTFDDNFCSHCGADMREEKTDE